MSTKRRIAKKKLMEAKRALNRARKKASEKQQKEIEQSRGIEQDHWNYPNSYVALAFLAYNGIENELSCDRVRELCNLMNQNMKDNYHVYWIYSCGYHETDLWDYDREKGIFTRRPEATTIALIRYVVKAFDRTQLEAVFPGEVVQELLAIKLEEDRKEKALIYEK